MTRNSEHWLLLIYLPGWAMVLLIAASVFAPYAGRDALRQAGLVCGLVQLLVGAMAVVAAAVEMMMREE